jgi:hypothetical protein
VLDWEERKEQKRGEKGKDVTLVPLAFLAMDSWNKCHPERLGFWVLSHPLHQHHKCQPPARNL